jgi:hypothetical protein
VPANEQTPCVVALLEIMEQLRETIQQQDEEIGRLQAEMALLSSCSGDDSKLNTLAVLLSCLHGHEELIGGKAGAARRDSRKGRTAIQYYV